MSDFETGPSITLRPDYGPVPVIDPENLYIPVPEGMLKDLVGREHGVYDLEKIAFDGMPPDFDEATMQVGSSLELLSQLTGQAILSIVGPDEGSYYIRIPKNPEKPEVKRRSFPALDVIGNEITQLLESLNEISDGTNLNRWDQVADTSPDTVSITISSSKGPSGSIHFAIRRELFPDEQGRYRVAEYHWGDDQEPMYLLAKYHEPFSSAVNPGDERKQRPLEPEDLRPMRTLLSDYREAVRLRTQSEDKDNNG